MIHIDADISDVISSSSAIINTSKCKGGYSKENHGFHKTKSICSKCLQKLVCCIRKLQRKLRACQCKEFLHHSERKKEFIHQYHILQSKLAYGKNPNKKKPFYAIKCIRSDFVSSFPEKKNIPYSLITN